MTRIASPGTTCSAVVIDLSLFNYLMGYSAKVNYRKILVAPLQLREKVRELIYREIKHQEMHGDGRIIIKMNALVDEDMIKML